MVSVGMGQRHGMIAAVMGVLRMESATMVPVFVQRRLEGRIAARRNASKLAGIRASVCQAASATVGNSLVLELLVRAALPACHLITPVQDEALVVKTRSDTMQPPAAGLWLATKPAMSMACVPRPDACATLVTVVKTVH